MPKDQDGTADVVLIWGKPSGFGINDLGAKLAIYLMYNELPEPGDEMVWDPWYIGASSPAPIWTKDQAEAAPLLLMQPHEFRATEESIDQAAWQLSIKWIPAVERWVMLYGGGLEAFNLDAYPKGIYMRQARVPWGPWSPPELILSEAELKAQEPELIADGQPASEEIGNLYTPNIIQQWTVNDSTNREANIYWNLSTWRPYHVILMKTHLKLVE
jgi:hypothetical protein